MSRLSDAAAHRLRDELADLTGRQRAAANRGIEESRSAGDIGENPDFFIAAAEHSRVESRIERIEAMLRAHDEADPVAIPVGVAGHGSVVTLDFGGGDCEQYLIGSIEERPEDMDVLSASSPLGKAVTGATAGQVVHFTSPAGVQQVTVLAVVTVD